MNAAIHVCNNQRTNVLILNSSLVFIVSPCSISIKMGVVLQITLSSLITNWTVERVIGQQKLHNSTASESRNFRIRPDFHSRSNLRAAGGDRFGGFLDFDETHPAVSCDLETFVVAEARDLNAVLFGCLEDGEIVIHLVGLVVDEDFDLLGGEGSAAPKEPPHCG